MHVYKCIVVYENEHVYVCWHKWLDHIFLPLNMTEVGVRSFVCCYTQESYLTYEFLAIA